ncbi:MAG: YebC/PmpR family DNA-binding transcriptional regulator [Clostridia bacterium]|nr:YebC/PmpR family DNA-binding transcriptional regulator [Clostridia bacterium]MBR3145359.1 YebC/PmpR family DNA-binding transcriptional regulator [Clostridia bacterium]
MSGHSKWNNIKRKKEKTDAAKAKIFTKIGKEISVIVKQGGPNPLENSRLKDAIAKAKAANVPNDNIERIIKKAAGESGGSDYEELIYEGYGPCGIAVVVETLTDNRNRTAGDIRHYFDKFGGNLGQSGSVMFMFDRKGVIEIEGEGNDEETVMDAALEAGAEDFNFDGDVFEITTAPAELGAVRDNLEAKGYSFLSAEVQYIPTTTSKIDDPAMQEKMEKLIDALEENDDVQAIWHNWEIEE